VWENHRAATFRRLLLALTARDDSRAADYDEAGFDHLSALGELMLQSHESTNRCGLGSAKTGRLVELVRERLGRGVFGARITGGGSGGTVAVLASNNEAGAAAVQAIATQFAVETGKAPKVFQPSSAGAMAFDHLRVQFGRKP